MPTNQKTTHNKKYNNSGLQCWVEKVGRGEGKIGVQSTLHTSLVRLLLTFLLHST